MLLTKTVYKNTPFKVMWRKWDEFTVFHILKNYLRLFDFKLKFVI
jgi:hypothetical protein